MVKHDIVNEVVNRTGLRKTRAEIAVETVFETMKRSMERGERIELRRFGVFKIRPRKTGIGRNPRTGERGSTLLTSNLPFNEWTEILGSERLTGALLDRLTHHVHILEMNGDSYRLKQSKRARA